MSMNETTLARIATALERIANVLEAGKGRGTTTTAAASPASQRSDGPTLPNYGRSKGQPIATASIDDLHWYGTRCAESINDPSKSRWRDTESARLAAINAELKRRGQSPVGEESGTSDDFGPPPGYRDAPGPSDEDIPF